MSDENPWLSVWVRPRSTIQRIVAQNPNRAIWILAFIYGLTSLLNGFQSYPIALQIGLVPMLILTVILAAFWGYLIFTIWSLVVVWVGKLFKGQASFSAARAAYAWSCVPLLGNIPLWILLIFVYSTALFFGVQDHIVLSGTAAALLFIILLGKLIFAIWSLVIYLQMLSVVQQFSILRSIANVILAAILLGIAVGILWIFAAYVMNAMFGGPPVSAMLWYDTGWVVQQVK